MLQSIKLHVTSPNNIAAVAVVLTLRCKRSLMVRDMPKSAKATRPLQLSNIVKQLTRHELPIPTVVMHKQIPNVAV
jgi:hypothetical protein